MTKHAPANSYGYLQFMMVMLAPLLLPPAGAMAHAFLDHAEPKVGSPADKAMRQVKLWFTQNLEAAFSAIEVTDADGKQVDKKDSHLDSKSKSLLVVSVGELPSGTYKVHWHVVSEDTHATRGDFKFSVR